MMPRRVAPRCLAVSALALLASCTAKQVLRGRSDSQNATGNETYAANMTLIAERFTQMDAQVDSLRMRLSTLTDGIVQVQSLANMTGAGVVKSEQDLKGVMEAINVNADAAAGLKAAFDEAATRLKAQQNKTMSMVSTISSLQQSAMQLGQASSGLGKKVGELEAVMKDVMPGRDSLTGRLDNATKMIKEYTEEAQAGKLDPIVAAKLHANFVRARRQTEALAQDALKRQQEKEEASSPQALDQDAPKQGEEQEQE